MSTLIAPKNFDAAIALLVAAKLIEKVGEDALDDILEDSGYSDNEIISVESVSLNGNGFDEIGLVVEFTYFSDDEDAETSGTTYIKYVDEKLVADF